MTERKFPIIIKMKNHYFQIWKQREIEIGTATFVRTSGPDLIESWDLKTLEIEEKFKHLVENTEEIEDVD